MLVFVLVVYLHRRTSLAGEWPAVKGAQQCALLAFHDLGFVFLHVVVSTQMQKTMDDEEANFIFERRPEFPCLRFSDIGCDDDIAKFIHFEFGACESFVFYAVALERKNVCDQVDTSIVVVERFD